jgi:hypothetical protein
MAKVEMSEEAISLRLEELSRASRAGSSSSVDMSEGAVTDRLMSLSEASALCFELAPQSKNSSR